jgi:hypothetical protein
MPEIIETSQQHAVLAQQGRQQHNMDVNSTIWAPTTQYVRQQHNMDANSTIWTPKSRQNGEKGTATKRSITQRVRHKT